MGSLRTVRGWVEDRRDGIVVLLLAVSLVLNVVTITKVERDERASITNSIPASVCLLETFRRVEPLLAKAPDVQAPLRAFLTIQGSRYTGRRCPDQAGEAAALGLPKVR